MFKPVVFFLSKSEPGGMVGKRGRQHSAMVSSQLMGWGCNGPSAVLAELPHYGDQVCSQ